MEERRKKQKVHAGFMKYFPDAIKAVAHISVICNEQHNAGEPLQWAKDKSNEHLESLGRHLLESGTYDTDGVLNDVKIAWRALANLQIIIENGTDYIYPYIDKNAVDSPERGVVKVGDKFKCLGTDNTYEVELIDDDVTYPYKFKLIRGTGLSGFSLKLPEIQEHYERVDD